MLLWSNLSEIVVLNKSFVTTKDDVVAGLEREKIKLRNNIMGLKEELEHTKAAKDKLQQELDDVANGA